MAIFSSAADFRSLDDLFINQLRELYDAEYRLIQALPKMVEAASSPKLKRMFTEQLGRAHVHMQRLAGIFSQINQDPKGETCKAMKGLLEEGCHMMEASGVPAVKDAGLIATTQRVDHYEISGYGTARSFAMHLGLTEAARLLDLSLRDEEEADRLLTELAETDINLRAAA